MIKSAYHLSELAGQNSSIVMKIPLLRKMQPDQSVPKTYFVKFRFLKIASPAGQSCDFLKAP